MTCCRRGGVLRREEGREMCGGCDVEIDKLELNRAKTQTQGAAEEERRVGFPHCVYLP